MRDNMQQLSLVAIVLGAAVVVTSCGLFGGDDEDFASPPPDYVGFERLDLNFGTRVDAQAL